MLSLPRENGHSCVQFYSDAGQTPHIDGWGIGNPEHDLRGSIEPGLYISVDLLALKARGAKIDDLDCRALRAHQQNILRLKIAVNNGVFLTKPESFENLLADFPDEDQIQSLKLAKFQKLIQIHVQEFKYNTYMVAELEGVFHADDMLAVVSVHLIQVLQNIDLYQGLSVVFSLVSDDLECHDLVVTVIYAFQYLPERPFPEYTNDLVSILDMVSNQDSVFGLRVIKAEVSGLRVRIVLFVQSAQVVDLFELLDFFDFVT